MNDSEKRSALSRSFWTKERRPCVSPPELRKDQLDIQDSTFFTTCPPTPLWPESAFISCDGDPSTLPPGDCGLEEIDFVPRAPIERTMCEE